VRSTTPSTAASLIGSAQVDGCSTAESAWPLGAEEGLSLPAHPAPKPRGIGRAQTGGTSVDLSCIRGAEARVHATTCDHCSRKSHCSTPPAYEDLRRRRRATTFRCAEASACAAQRCSTSPNSTSTTASSGSASAKHPQRRRRPRDEGGPSVSPSTRSHCRPGTGTASENCQPATGVTVSTMNRTLTDEEGPLREGPTCTFLERTTGFEPATLTLAR
jgi:hypothetical protein